VSVHVAHLGLGIDSRLVTPTASNYRPPSWPPPKNFPIVIDAHGSVVSRYGDSKWRLWPWARKPLTLAFGDGPQRAGTSRNTPVNADLLRQVSAWWLYGPQPVREPETLKSRFSIIRALFVLCSREKIAASDLMRFPKVADKLPMAIRASGAGDGLTLLHALFEQRDQLGFVLLDREGLSRLEAALPDYEKRQTPYIPPRIWTYQVNRLRAFLDDFLAHRQGIEDCFQFCLDAYAQNAGSLAAACRDGPGCARRPFAAAKGVTGARTGAAFHGTFSLVARRFGIEGLLRRWLLAPDGTLDGRGRGIRSLGTYFSMASYVGLAYLLNFSMMRIEEGWSLRSTCLDIEHDERFGPIYLLRGPTTKTVQDGDARWITSPSAAVAVEAMSCISRLRMIAAEADPDVPTTPEHMHNPYLIVRTYEPWNRAHARCNPMDVRPQFFHYSQVKNAWPNLFDENELRMTDEDLRVARLVTPTLDADTFSVGKVWPLAWHQLRRTGAVNMQASGLVSDASVQYQLKHATRAMSLYYGQGYSRVRLNQSTQDEYIRTMYEVLGKQIARLFSDRFVSPHGEARKDEILRLVDPSDNKKLTAAARNGKVSWRETLLGGCTKIGPCEYGGVDNIARCGGGDGRAPCVDALFDREKAPEMRQLKKIIKCRLVEAPDPSPYRDSLESQQRAVENALNVILK
jgi:hypothetical protein